MTMGQNSGLARQIIGVAVFAEANSLQNKSVRTNVLSQGDSAVVHA